MRIKIGLSAGICILGAACLALPAHANSRFNVVNDANEKVVVHIFNGDDKICAAESKHHDVLPGTEKSMGCEGGGKHRCKALLAIKIDDNWQNACAGQMNGCGDTAILLENHATLTVGKNGDNCNIAESSD